MNSTVRPFEDSIVYAIVLNYNGLHLNSICLKSLIASHYNNLHILFIDNGSSDGSVQAVRDEFPDVEVLENGENLYFAAGNNRGIEYAIKNAADYIFILNNDTKIVPSCITQLVSFMESSPQTAACQPLLCFMDDHDIIASTGCRIAGSGKAWDAMCGMPAEDAGENPFPMPGVTGGAMFVRTNVISTVGMFDENFGMYFEDVDLSLRMRKHGFELFCIPSARVYHEVSASTKLSKKWRIGYFCERNSYKVMVKNFPLPQILLGFLRGVPMACIAASANLIRGNFKYGFSILFAVLYGLGYFFKHWPSLHEDTAKRERISQYIDYQIIYPPRCTKITR
ncbi:glycosyltransferase family 2 protein [Maridesulfovibrio bastinii]|uniref:glycosyltransferase family 2 protein n=1 Tax=Maridesulfovibrio bastinii TaxID=47157 RepID=UPI0004132998|nr:glycosyltransferase family 2 protein [Maridesulfovibrio bastinii]